ncbi:MAG TPA: Hsp20/alpha crystallin family protein [Bacteroidota bacterium]|nr:Hsp20/alpha crystallin family protein [Bacteroidota bacterium]
MTLVRWRPAHELPTFPSDVLGMQKEINRMFENFFRGGLEDTDLMTSSWTPAVDLAETADEYLAKVELPGVDKNGIKITMENNVLTIRGEKSQEKKEKDVNFHRVERFYGSFQRSFELPGTVKNEKIEAEFKDGILTIRMPKAEEAKSKQIDVKVR